MTVTVADPLDAAVAELVELHRGRAGSAAVWGRQFDLGLAWPDFDEGSGGRGLDRGLRSTIWRRLATEGIPHPRSINFVGIGMAAELLHTHGTPEQRRKHLRATFCGDQVWCQLFSEPGAGSDLANVSAAATRDGDCWVVSGQKVWTSFAHEAQFGLLLARTDPDAPKHRGLTMFLLDMTTPGIDVRPLRMMTGDAEFNEVFLDEVGVPDACRIGEVGRGWQMTVAVLMNERSAVGAIGEGDRGVRPIDRALEAWARQPADPVARDRLARLWIEARVLELTTGRAAAAAQRGNPGPEGAVLRIFAAEHNARVYDFLTRTPAAGLTVPGGYPDGESLLEGRARWNLQREFLFSRGLMIGGGTLEVSRNVVGERVLGLPPEPRVDRDVSWREAQRPVTR